MFLTCYYFGCAGINLACPGTPMDVPQKMPIRHLLSVFDEVSLI